MKECDDFFLCFLFGYFKFANVRSEEKSEKERKKLCHMERLRKMRKERQVESERGPTVLYSF